MHIYLLLITFVFAMLYLSRNIKYNTKIKFLFIIFSFIPFVLVAGLRYNVGTDFPMYNQFFYIFKNKALFGWDIEVMFVLFCKIIHLFSDKSVWLFMSIAFFISYNIYSISIKSEKFYEMSIFLFIAFGFYLSSLNILRQWMGASILLGVYYYMAKKQNIQVIIRYIICCLCHYSSILLLPFYSYIKNNIKHRNRIITMGLATIIYLYPEKIISIILTILKMIGFGEKYYKYLQEYNNSGASIFGMPMFCIITYIMFTILSKKRVESHSDFNKKYDNILLNVLSLAFGFSLIGTKIMIFERLQFYFLPVMILMIPRAFERLNFTNKDKKMIYNLILTFGYIFFIYSLINNGGEPLPYQTIFSI